MKDKKMKHIVTILLVFLALLQYPASAAVLLRLQDGETVLDAKDAKLGDLLEEIRRKYAVSIVGLENREGETVTFSAKEEMPEDLLKRLFRYLGEENYAMEFTDIKLTKVSVFPGSKKRRPFPSAEGASETSAPQQFSNVVEVKEIVAGSQAQDLNLQKGDFVISYNGIRITSAQQLAGEVRKTSDKDTVEITAVRNKEVMPMVLKGGIIGIQIVTTSIPAAEAESYSR